MPVRGHETLHEYNAFFVSAGQLGLRKPRALGRPVDPRGCVGHGVMGMSTVEIVLLSYRLHQCGGLLIMNVVVNFELQGERGVIDIPVVDTLGASAVAGEDWSLVSVQGKY